MLKKEIPATSHQPFLRKERGQAVQSHPENNQSTGRRRPIQDLRHRDDSVFFVRQRLTAIDASGNLVNLTFASGNPSHASGQLPSLEHAYGR